MMMSARSTERAERAGKGCSGADIPCGRGQGAPVLGVCPGARARPLGAGGSWRNSTIYLQHERREDEVVSRAGWLCPSAALGIPPWSSRLCCPGSHRDILTGTLLTSRASCSPQVTPGACSKLRAGAAGPGRRKAPGWGPSSGLGLSLPGGLCLCTPCMDTRTPTLGSSQDSALPHLSPSLARTGSSPWGIRGPGKVLAPQHQGGESQPGLSFAAAGSCPQPSPSHPTSKPSSESLRMDPNVF